MYTFEDKLKEYAELLVRVGVNVQKGQDLVITSQVDQAPFARLCVQAAYEAGARAVDMAWSDDAIARMTYLNADESVFDVIPEYRIRFITDYDASLAISTETGYTSPNAEVIAELSGAGGEYEGNSAYIPRAGYEKDEMYTDNPKLAAELSDKWLKVMSSK